MASQTDFLTTGKNAVVAINNLNQTIAAHTTAITAQADYYAGQYTSGATSALTLVSAGAGYLVSFAVTVAGAAGTLNNAATTGAAAASNALCATPATVGIYPVGARFTNGLVINPGAGQTLLVTYSLD